MLISEKIFALMEQRGMTQKKFSEQTEISQSTISDGKRKKTNPSAEKILKICEVLQVTPYELLSETDFKSINSELTCDFILSKDERNLIEVFRTLDIKQRQRLKGYMEALSDLE